MSESQAGEARTPEENLGVSKAVSVSSPGSLEARLMAARAKRALALAEQKGAATNALNGTAEKLASRSACEPLAGQSKTQPDRSERSLSPFAIKAAFIFIGATGFGLGSVMALGFLAGLGPIRGTPDMPAKTVLSAPVAVQETPLNSVKATTAPEEAPRLVGMIDKNLYEDPDIEPFDIMLPEPPTAVHRQVAMPMISKVVYMHAETDADTALKMRSLPQVPEPLESDSVATLSIDKSPRVFMHAPDGIPNYSLQQVVAELEKSGVEVANIGRESFRVSSSHVRYFSPATQTFAMSVANSLGIEARDFSENAVNPERIELWIAGRPKPVEEIASDDEETAFDRMRALIEMR
jgi:hypothetical protein